MTKDERFLLELYRELKGDKEGTLDPNSIAQKLGFKQHLTLNIIKGLQRANLIKRYSPQEVGLTERGLAVAQSLCP